MACFAPVARCLEGCCRKNTLVVVGGGPCAKLIQTTPGNGRARCWAIPGFRPRRAALILVALALAITVFAALLTTPAPAQAAETTLWSAELTVGKHSDNTWYGLGKDSNGTTYGTITPDSFTHDGTTYNIRSLISSQQTSGTTLFFDVRYSIGFQNLMTLTVGGRDFDGSAAGVFAENSTFTWDTNPALTWAVGDTVAVSLKATVPDKPGKPVATAGPGKVDLTWADPNDASITKYQYRQKEGSGGFGNWQNISGSGASTTSYEVTGLTVSAAYIFQVRAVNAAGLGAASDESEPARPTGRPPAPTGFNVTAGPGKVDLAWANPDDANINKYQYRQSTDGGGSWSPDWNDIDGSGASTTSYEVTGLTAGTPYTFQVRAVNAVGPGAWAEAVPVTPAAATAPAAPTDFSATSGDESAILSWTAAANNGAPITKYQYQQDGGAWNDIDNSAPGGANAVSFTVTGLTNGATYAFKLRAENSLGAGAESAERIATPAGMPLAPTGFSATRGDGSVLLSWTAANDNGAALTKYQYQQDGSWKDIPDSAPGGANALSFTVTGLTNGTIYTFKLRAVNSEGAGAETAERTATPVAAQATEIELWSATLTVGKRSGQNEFGYNFQYNYGSLSPTSFSHGGKRYTFPGFSYGTDGDLTLYFFPDMPFKSVLMLIVDGESFPASAGNSFSGSLFWSNHGLTWAVGDTVSVSLKATLPGAPTNFSATAGPVKAVLAWANPSDTTITKYQYRQSTDGSTWSPNWKNIPNSGASTTSHTVTGLTVGTAYIFQVRAVNAAGPGAETQPLSVTSVAGAPSAPPDFRATEGDESAILSWTAAAANGAAITKYQYQQDGGAWNDIADSAPGEANAVSFTVENLTNGNTYTFKLRAVNNIGAGAETDEKTATPVAAAAQPTGLTATANHLGATLNWTDPSDSTITAYQIRQSTDGDSNWSPDWTEIAGSGPTTVLHQVTGLVNAITFTFQIRAMRGNVASVESESATVTAVLPPAKPANFEAAAGDRQVTLTWDDPNDVTITGYGVKQGTGEWTDIPDSAPGGANALSFTVTELVNGTPYTFQIRAMQGDLAGVSSDSKTGTPGVVPLAPTGFSATEGDESTILRWTAADDNGSPITGYQHQQDGGAWTNIPDSAPGGTNAVSFTVTGLNNGNTYTFKLRAVNSVGAGADTAERTATPAAQNDLWSATLTAGKHDSHNRFGYNSEHGYGSLSSTSFTHGGETYTVTELEYHSGSSLNLLFTPDIPFKSALTLIVDGEEFPASGAFSVSSSFSWVNPGFTWAVGDTVSVALKATPLDAPANFSAAAGDGEVALSWDDPSDNTITKYQSRQKEGTGVNFGNWNDIAGSGATTISYTVTGLTNGAAYTFQVRAAVATLGGAASETVTATLAAPDKNAPVFASDMYSRSVAENSAANTPVGAPVTATDPDSDDLTYSLSGADADSFAIDASTGQITVGSGASLDYETKASYSVTVSVHDGKDADGNADTTVDDTITVTIGVTNVDEPGAVALSPAQPVVGTALTATLIDLDGSVSGETWKWERSPDQTTWAEISGAASAIYTPVTGDAGNYLRATASYTDPHGAGKNAVGVTAIVLEFAEAVTGVDLN